MEKQWLDPYYVDRWFMQIQGFQRVDRFAALKGQAYMAWALSPIVARRAPALFSVAEQVRACVDADGNAWHYGNGAAFLRFLASRPELCHMFARGLEDIQVGTQEGASLTAAGEVPLRVRVDKPWGWELIGPTVRQAQGTAEEGYTYKILVIVGPLSNQYHEDYVDAAGARHAAKVETQMVLGPFPYRMRTADAIYSVPPGEMFHIPMGTWHQPSVRPGEVSLVAEVSKPNIGPGSTTRDPEGDPWKAFRTTNDT